MRNPARSLKSKVFHFFLAFLITFSLLSPSVIFAQSPASDDEFYQTVEADVEQTPSTKYQTAFFGITSAVLCQITGVDLANPQKGCLIFNPETQKLGYSPQTSDGRVQIGGLLGVSSQMIGLMYTQPASSTQYVGYLADNFGFTHTTHAQEEDVDARDGFEGLSAILGLFIKMRDITYLLLVIVFIIVGVGIMLRLHLDPRTVMTIQNQIPKLIIGIVLITFSYSIAGFLFDMTWVATYFGINVITEDAACENPGNQSLTSVATTNLLNAPPSYVSDLFSDAGCLGRFDGISGIAWNVSTTISDILSRFITYMLGGGEGDNAQIGNEEANQSGSDACDGFFGIFGGNVAQCFELGVYNVIKWALGTIFFVILFVSLLIALFRVWFMMLRAYISILIAIILSPFWILIGMVPGGGYGFMQWLRHMVAHLAIFPVAAWMFTLASVIAGNEAANNPDTSYLPPLIGNPNIGDNIAYLTAIGFLLLTPDLLNILRDTLKTPAGKYTGDIFGNAQKGSPTRLATPLAQISGLTYGFGSIGQLRGMLAGRFGGTRGAPPPGNH